MGKVIRLKQGDVFKLVQKIVTEQNFGEPNAPTTVDNPLDLIKPPTRKPMMSKRMPDMGHPQVNKEIIQRKLAVRGSLQKLLSNISALMEASGVNPETNNIVADVEKLSEKFEHLFGDPTPESEDVE